jgi:hypothetical protein
MMPGPAHAGPSSDIVRGLNEAFNRRDVDAMRAYWTTDITWYDVAGDQLSLVAQGLDAMDAGMKDYFKAYPDTRSELSELIENGPFVTGLETATWTSKSGLRAQSSIVVYEVRDSKVRRVWYYPSEKRGNP